MSDKTNNCPDDFNFILTDSREDIDLLLSFKESYPTLSAIQTKEQFLTMVNLNEGIRNWYLTYKQYRSTFLVKPKWLPDNKESLDNWAKLQDKLSTQKKLFRSWDVRIESKSIALKAEIKAVGDEKGEYFKNLDPLLVINSMTVNNLSAEETLEIALEGDLDKRSSIIDSKVEKLKSRLYSGYINNNFDNPYLK